MNKAMLRLDVTHREALVLKEYEGLSYQEIAEIMRLTVPAVRSPLYKARIALKTVYTEIATKR